MVTDSKAPRGSVPGLLNAKIEMVAEITGAGRAGSSVANAAGANDKTGALKSAKTSIHFIFPLYSLVFTSWALEVQQVIFLSLGAFFINFVNCEMHITAKCISALMLAAEFYFPIGDSLDVKQVLYRYIIGSEIFPTRSARKGHRRC